MFELTPTTASVLCIGCTYLDYTFSLPFPIGNQKVRLADLTKSLGGNAVVTALALKRLGFTVELLTTVPDDDYQILIRHKFAKHGIHLYDRRVSDVAISMISSVDGQRAMARYRNDDYLDKYPELVIDPYTCLHTDGHQPEASRHYASLFSDAGKSTFFDGGTYRGIDTDMLMPHISVAFVSNDFCDQLGLDPPETIEYLMKFERMTVAGVTLGDMGTVFKERHLKLKHVPARAVPKDQIKDTNGAGDVFHAGVVAAALCYCCASWSGRIAFASAAAAHRVLGVGNEQNLPSAEDVVAIGKNFGLSSAKPPWWD